MVTVIEDEASPEWLTLFLQAGDALFPTGSYAHSLGFEEAVALGLVRDERSLGHYLHVHIAPGLIHLELPYLRFACAASAAGDWQLLAELDVEIGAAKLARETREASAQIGTRRLKALSVILPEKNSLAACSQAIQAGKMAGHHAIVCGVQASVAGLPLAVALGSYFYQGLAATSSAALKLIRIGQDGVHRALRAASLHAPSAVARSLEITRNEAGWFDPLAEIASMRHERAGERLFIS